MNHATEVKGKDLKELAVEIGNLRYDALVSFLDALATDLYRQSEGDKKRGRPKLAAALFDAAGEVAGAAADMDYAWSICEPYMRSENGQHQSKENEVVDV